jgi:hypothetical protein
MGCWHGCGPVHCGPSRRGWYGPADEDGWYEDVRWPMRHQSTSPPDDRGMREAALEARLDELREDLRRVEAALAGLVRPFGDAPREG